MNDNSAEYEVKTVTKEKFPENFQNNEAWTNGLREIITYIENCCDVQRDIDVAYDKLCHVIMNEMKTYLNEVKYQGTKSHKKRRKYKEYRDNDLHNLWNRVCAKEKQFIKSKGGGLNKQMLRTEYLDAQRQLDNLLRIEDRQNRREKLIKLGSIKTADPVTFWKEINQLGASRANTIPMRVSELGFKNADWAGLRVCLNTLNWEACLASDNVDICAKFWTKTYLETAKKFIPFRSVRIRPNDKPWYCNKLRALKRKRDRLFRKAKLSKLASDWVTYKRSRNEYAHELSKSVSEHDNKVLNSINDNKTYEKGWWRTIRVFFIGVHLKIPALQTDDGCVFSNSMDKANLFNKMFFFLQRIKRWKPCTAQLRF